MRSLTSFNERVEVHEPGLLNALNRDVSVLPRGEALSSQFSFPGYCPLRPFCTGHGARQTRVPKPRGKHECNSSNGCCSAQDRNSQHRATNSSE